MRKTSMLVVVLLLFGVSCREYENVQPAKTVIAEKIFEPSADIGFNGEYLVFPTPESFQKTYESLQNSNPESVRKWNAQFGFNSLRTIYETAVEEQEKYLNNILLEYQSFPAGDPRLKKKPVIEQPAYVKEHADLLVLNKDGLIWRTKLSNYDMTALVNKDGLVKIAGHLFQYNNDNIKIIVGGEAGKIAALKNVNETNEELNIVVKPVTHELVKEGEKELPSVSGRVWYDYWNQTPHWTDPNNLDYAYYFNYEIHISIYYYPIYDTTPICEPEGCGQARTSQPMDCNCYYPIIGYTGYSRYENHMETRKVFMGSVNSQTHCNECKIDVHYQVAGGGFFYPSSHTRYNFVNTYHTVYDNTPAIEFICANQDFYANVGVNFNIGIDASWCDY